MSQPRWSVVEDSEWKLRTQLDRGWAREYGKTETGVSIFCKVS